MTEWNNAYDGDASIEQRELEELVRDPDRLSALYSHGILDTPPEAAFDRLTRLATRLLGVPVSLVSLVDENRQFLKSSVGLPEPWASWRETPLSHSFCQHLVVTREPLVIDDSRLHPQLWNNLAIPDIGVIAYAGIPLMLSDGQVLGSFCAIDVRPREWSEDDLSTLTDLAALVLTELELRVVMRQIDLQARAVEQERMRVVQERNEIFITAVHDLKTPLTAIKGLAQFAQRRLRRGGDENITMAVGDLAQIDSASMRMNAAISSLLDIARLDMGEPLQLNSSPVDLVALVWRVVEDQKPDAPDHDIVIDPSVGELIGEWDEVRLERVLHNLVGNAVKYSPGGGDVVVKIALDDHAGDHWAVMRVDDWGLGIPADDVERVFDRFHRGSNVLEGVLGTGVGLTGARQIVEQHGGTIHIESREGKGTSVTVRLPIVPS